jgi:hypothetical protein
MRAALRAALESGFFEKHEGRPRAVACRRNVPDGPSAEAGIYQISRLIAPVRGRYSAFVVPNSFSPFLYFGVIRAKKRRSRAERFSQIRRRTAKGGSLSVDGTAMEAFTKW